MSNNFISVIIPAHNEEDYIGRTLTSIVNSAYKNYELIVVCDACSDKTEEISKKYTDKIYSVNFKNVSKARNHGASHARGDILIFTDADTICSDNYFSSIIGAINSGFDYGCAEAISESGTKKGKFIMELMNSSNKNNKTVGGNCFVKKEHFSKIDGFNDNFRIGEDTDLGDRLGKNGAQYIFIKNSHVIPSERRYKEYWYLDIFSSSLKNWFIYQHSRRKYKKFISKS
jgi:glycosyltransferase involved in cell wall biosynthesis